MKKILLLSAMTLLAVFSLQAGDQPANADANAVTQEAPAMEANATAESNESNTSADDNSTQATEAAPAEAAPATN